MPPPGHFGAFSRPGRRTGGRPGPEPQSLTTWWEPARHPVQLRFLVVFFVVFFVVFCVVLMVAVFQLFRSFSGFLVVFGGGWWCLVGFSGGWRGLVVFGGV